MNGVSYYFGRREDAELFAQMRMTGASHFVLWPQPARTDQTIIVSGSANSQQFVPVQTGTGVLVSTGSVHVTGVQTEATVVEVRRGPVGTGDVPSYFGAVSEAKTGKPSLIVDFLYRGITHEYGNFHAAPPSGCLGAVALVVVVILATICAVMVVVQP